MEQPEQSPGMNLTAFMVNWEDVLKEEAIPEDSGIDDAVVIADTLEELAKKLGVDEVAFLQHVAEYNESTKHPAPAGGGMPPMMMDDDDDEDKPDPEMHAKMFGAPKPKLPIGEGPFYALKLKMFHENAVGGMTIDENASVLKNGKPIPGLYAAGDTTRGIMIPGDVGVGYIEGVFTALTQALNEGYIAAVAAVDSL